jgi:hypothetical protein
VFHLPRIPVGEIDVFLFEVAAVVSTAVFVFKYIKSKFHKPKCYFVRVPYHPMIRAVHSSSLPTKDASFTI